MLKKSTSKFNWQIVFNSLIIINLIISLLAIFLLFRVNEGVNFATWKDTYNDSITQKQIECIKSPSADCEKEVKQLQKIRQNFIEEAFKGK